MRQTKRQFLEFKLISFLCFCLLVVAISGCVTTEEVNQTKTFSEAAVLTVTNTAAAFKLVEDRQKEVLLAHEVRAIPTNPLDYNPGTFTNVFFYSGTNGLEMRLEVLAGLEIYATKLSALMGNSSLSNYDSYTATLGSSLIDIDTNLVKASILKNEPISDGDLQLLTTGINILGHWIIAYQQQKDSKEAVVKMQGTITNICCFFTNDIPILEEQAFKDDYNTFYEELTLFRDDYSWFKNNPVALASEVQKLHVLKGRIGTDQAVFESLSSAVNAMQKAHTSLGELFSGNKTNTAAADMEEFATEAQRIGKFYNSLQPTAKTTN